MESGLAGLEQWDRLSRRSFTIQMLQGLHIREVEAQLTLYVRGIAAVLTVVRGERRGAEVFAFTAAQ